MNKKTDIPVPLSLDDFASFHRALYGYRPFRWQQRLASQVCGGQWPDYIKLPTSSGKTAVIDMAVFGLAYQAATPNRPEIDLTAPRRIFFVVDRRIIVNEAYRRAHRAARLLHKTLDPNAKLNDEDSDFFDRLDEPHREILTQVARWLQHLAGDASVPPLDCFELRGGIYRDDAWVRSPLQPTVLTSTVDQVGSRLLFRGYGVSDRNLSIHAALTANDSLIILDEAHCSNPFSQTLDAIQRYRGTNWAREAVETPFRFVQMTATPPPDVAADQVFELVNADYEADPSLARRHSCGKPVSLVLADGAKGMKLTTKLAKKLVEQAASLASEHQLRKIAVVVNRVAVAREAFALLDKKHSGRVSLMIGRMRPLDRDELTKSLQREFGAGWTGNSNEAEDVQPQFVVATQCLEVGADLDFDGMVCQCASLDALRQRFGRLNRLGESAQARGVIVAAEGDIVPLEKLDDAKPLDPIYGNALARTWHWINRCATNTSENNSDEGGVIDFGIKALEPLCLSGANSIDMQELSVPAPNAPVLMPAHVDMLCQTSPRPSPEPDVAAYLHGPNRDCPEVRVCWRADLDLSRLDQVDQKSVKRTEKNWIRAIDLCPPSSAECLAVPLHVFSRWLRDDAVVDDSGDVLGEAVEPDQQNARTANTQRTVLVWRGRRKRGETSDRSFLANSNNLANSNKDRRIRPNDTVVVPAEFGGWKSLGHIPDAPRDPAEESEQFSTTDPCELHRILMKRSTASMEAPQHEGSMGEAQRAIYLLANIDIANEAFLQSRARTILRVHPKLCAEPELRTLWDELLNAEVDDDANLSIARWRRRAEEIRQAANAGSDSWTPILTTGGTICRYQDGLAWITDRQPQLLQGMLPLSTFGDDDDSLSLTGKVPLLQHLSDVLHEAERLCKGLSINARLANTVLIAAKSHDIGKADARFQAMLIGKPLSVAFMQQKLWAKSEGNWRNSSSELPNAFRHEMLSLSLLDYLELADEEADTELLRHEVAAHHGYARPFAPVCIDAAPPGLNLRSFGGGSISSKDRSQWTPPHRLDSGIAERFWALNRRYGWWGLAYLESLLRLADWAASADPGHGQRDVSIAMKPERGAPSNSSPISNRLVFAGIDGSNPLGFLAALGAFRTLVESIHVDGLRMHWEKSDGAWRPALSCSNGSELVGEDIVTRLNTGLQTMLEAHPAIRLSDAVDAHGSRKAFLSASIVGALDNRVDLDWLSCNSSDMASTDSISQLQTTRRDYHSINIRGLVSTTTKEHLLRTLFLPWDYSDPIAGVSLHLEPREDRRHAYQWHMPSGDPTRSTCGGMIGANRLALEAWPLFQSLPNRDRLTTVGFRGTRANNTTFTWAIWSVPIDLETLRSVLSLARLHASDADVRELAACGIPVVYRCRRILVGKTPNLTSSIAALV